jgi:hypothetical protein
MHSDLLETRLIGERMRRLPQECEPPMTWDEFQRAQEAAAAREQAESTRMKASSSRSATPLRWQHLALAAGIAALVAGLAVWGRFSWVNGGGSSEAHVAQVETPVLIHPNMQYLIQAEASERWLARLPVEPAVMRVGTRTAVADLEDRIAWMDDVLSEERPDAIDPAHIVALQRERARLINSLAQVRYAETLVAAAQ